MSLLAIFMQHFDISLGGVSDGQSGKSHPKCVNVLNKLNCQFAADCRLEKELKNDELRRI